MAWTVCPSRSMFLPAQITVEPASPKGLGIALSQAGPGSRDQNDLAGDVKQVLSIHHAHIVQSSNLSFTESLWA